MNGAGRQLSAPSAADCVSSARQVKREGLTDTLSPDGADLLFEFAEFRATFLQTFVVHQCLVHEEIAPSAGTPAFAVSRNGAKTFSFTLTSFRTAAQQISVTVSEARSGA